MSAMIPYDFLDKVFLCHLHKDHWGDIDAYFPVEMDIGIFAFRRVLEITSYSRLDRPECEADDPFFIAPFQHPLLVIERTVYIVCRDIFEPSIYV